MVYLVDDDLMVLRVGAVGRRRELEAYLVAVQRIIDRYEALTGRTVDRSVVMLYSSVQRLAELGRSPDVDATRHKVLDWIAQMDAMGLAAAA